MLTSPVVAVADWLALACFGREKADKNRPTSFTLNGIPLSSGTVALMFASIELLMALREYDRG